MLSDIQLQQLQNNALMDYLQNVKGIHLDDEVRNELEH